MKKMRIFAMLLALCVLLSIPAMAADPVANDKITVTLENKDTTVVLKEVTLEDGKKDTVIEVTVTSSDLTPNDQYAILMLRSADGSVPQITEENASDILYIDQMAATGTTKGTVVFNVYPSALATSVIVITGVDGGPAKLAIVEGKFILGDANEDGVISGLDAVTILRYVAGLSNEKFNEQAANTDAEGSVTGFDAVRLLRYIAFAEALG